MNNRADVPTLLERVYCYLYWRLNCLAELLGENELANRFKAAVLAGGIMGLLALNGYLWLTRMFLSVRTINKFETPIVVVGLCLVVIFSLDRVLRRRFLRSKLIFEGVDPLKLRKYDAILLIFIVAEVIGSVASIHTVASRFPFGH